MEIASKYNPIEVEGKWYEYWLKNKCFSSQPDKRESYSLVIPPPNVTGILHMGHMLNNTIQDVLVRRARNEGKNACWVPGTDHASIATEAKVVNWIQEDLGKSKHEIGRDRFLEYAWEWTEKYGGTILEQLKRLGCSCDWERTKFTLDDDLSRSVEDVFIKLFERGLIYKGARIINWDPEALTNISDEEVNYEENTGKLYYLKYYATDSEEYLTVATTRPETIFGDTAVCVNPSDERYKNWIGKKVKVPLLGREVEVIVDDYVDPSFGTGCLKITPAHDANDYEIGKRHDLQALDIFNPNATLNEKGLHYEGTGRFETRKKIVVELSERSELEKTEDYVNKVGKSERTGAVIEPRLSSQWFVKMEELAKPALKALKTEELKLHPKKFENTYKHWLENIRDWNISRQLWWGHRIPVYYYGSGASDFVVAKTRDEALGKAREQSSKALNPQDLIQEEDVLDTWFSSWLWPMSVFDGVQNEENPDFQYFYPTSDLVTGPDIIFFWVARMVMAGYAFTGKSPFRNVYFTGIVRDNQRRKMSKQLGNSPDPIELIEKYGADGVRVGLLMATSAGNDLLFDEALCMQGRNFANKIWNAFRLVKSWKLEEVQQPQEAQLGIQWFESRLAEADAIIKKHLQKFRISDALLEMYKLIWDDFCSWYLEIAKPKYGDPIDPITRERTVYFFDALMRLLHPFMPFLTEEIWQNIETRKTGETISNQELLPNVQKDKTILKRFYLTKELVSVIRSFRKDNQISPKEALTLFAENLKLDEFLLSIATKLANVSSVEEVTPLPNNVSPLRVDTHTFGVPFQVADVEAEKEKVEKEIGYLSGFLKSAEKKLSNERFVNNAPKEVVETERKKMTDAQEKIKILEEKRKSL